MFGKEEAIAHARIRWKKHNRGAFTRISEKSGLSLSFVADVFYGKRSSSDYRVERELKQLQAPGFEHVE